MRGVVFVVGVIASVLFAAPLYGATAKYEKAAEYEKTAEPAKRIVALAPHIVENLYAIGAQNQLVATVEYADYPASAKKLPRIGNYQGINLEALVALKPDLIIAWQGGNKAKDLALLQRLGIKVAYSDPKKLSDIATELRYFGTLTGHQQQANKVAAQFTQRLKHIKEKYSKNKAVSVFYQLGAKPLMTAAANTWLDQQLQLCKGENIFADSPTPYPKVSIETVLMRQPHAIVMAKTTAKKWQQKRNYWQRWQQLPAVKLNNFIGVNPDLTHRFTIRSLDGLASLCSQLAQANSHKLN